VAVTASIELPAGRLSHPTPLASLATLPLQGRVKHFTPALLRSTAQLSFPVLSSQACTAV